MLRFFRPSQLTLFPEKTDLATFHLFSDQQRIICPGEIVEIDTGLFLIIAPNNRVLIHNFLEYKERTGLIVQVKIVYVSSKEQLKVSIFNSSTVNITVHKGDLIGKLTCFLNKSFCTNLTILGG
jgi:dUTPase